MTSLAASTRPVPTAFVVVGPAGSGKSSVSTAIARRFGAAYLDKDALATGFTELLLAQHGDDPHSRDDSEFYQREVLPLEYDALLRMCGDSLRVGTSVVLDAPFGRFVGDPEYLLAARERYAWPEAQLVVVHLETRPEVVLERLRQRGLTRDAWKIGHWAEFWRVAGSLDCAWEGARHVRVDNSGDTPDLSALEPTPAAQRDSR